MGDTFMHYKKQGDLGEELGYWFIKLFINNAHLTQSDFVINNSTIFEAKLLFKNENKWSLVEIKHKDPLKYGSFIGTGLNEYQLNARLQFHKDTGIDCLFLVFEQTGKNIYFQYLSELDKYKEYTRTGIVVYDYKYFNTIPKQLLLDKIAENITEQRKVSKKIRTVSDSLFNLLNIPNNVDYNKIQKAIDMNIKQKLLIKYNQL